MRSVKEPNSCQYLSSDSMNTVTRDAERKMKEERVSGIEKVNEMEREREREREKER